MSRDQKIAAVTKQREDEMKTFLSRMQFFCTWKVGQDINNEEKEHPKEGTFMSEFRAVQIFCAACLMTYEKSVRVCWLSNSKWSHMFHEDCILQWLATLGRTHSRAKLFSATPSEKKLLDFILTCPCCRQDFTSRKLILEKQENSWGMVQAWVA